MPCSAVTAWLWERATFPLEWCVNILRSTVNGIISECLGTRAHGCKVTEWTKQLLTPLYVPASSTTSRHNKAFPVSSSLLITHPNHPCHYTFGSLVLWYTVLCVHYLCDPFTINRKSAGYLQTKHYIHLQAINNNNKSSILVYVHVYLVGDVRIQAWISFLLLLFSQLWCLCKIFTNEMYYSLSHFQLVNNGPSRISHTLLQLKCPLKLHLHRFLYPLEIITKGPVNCTTHNIVNPMNIKVRDF